jgi:hypothetical protein
VEDSEAFELITGQEQVTPLLWKFVLESRFSRAAYAPWAFARKWLFSLPRLANEAMNRTVRSVA